MWQALYTVPRLWFYCTTLRSKMVPLALGFVAVLGYIAVSHACNAVSCAKKTVFKGEAMCFRLRL